MLREVSPFLTIVVPFHNSVGTCLPLLETLARLEGKDVELILVDDASADGTPRLLEDFASSFAGRVQIVRRDVNGGPGAARNSGLDLASGQFVWFVDSDDRIVPEAIAVGCSIEADDLDLIAWDWEHPTLSRRISGGVHEANGKPWPPDIFDPIVANWFSMDFIRRGGLCFPENCIYEATPLEAFALPLLVHKFLKVDFVAYLGSMDGQSVTRTRHPSARHFDRLATIALGMRFVKSAGLDPAARAPFDRAFIRLYLWYSMRLSKLPGPSWARAARLMRRFRDEARRFAVDDDPFDLYPGRKRSRLIARMLWKLSTLLPAQDDYFAELRKRSWQRPLTWDFPVLPKRARFGRGFTDPPPGDGEGNFLPVPPHP